jgi:hypothetical protein
MVLYCARNRIGAAGTFKNIIIFLQCDYIITMLIKPRAAHRRGGARRCPCKCKAKYYILYYIIILLYVIISHANAKQGTTDREERRGTHEQQIILQCIL